MHKKNSKSDIRVFEMANYVRPPVVESLTYDWVLNGRYNSFYDDLVDYYNGSVTHATIINSYTDLIYGRGLTLNHSEEQLVNWIKFRQALSKKTLKKIILCLFNWRTKTNRAALRWSTKGWDLTN